MTTLNIAIVEDEEFIKLFLEKTISLLGYKVIWSSSNLENTVSLLKKHTPDVILLDINLDNKFDGLKIASIINNQFINKTKFIFTTAYSNDEMIQKIAALKPYGYLMKPVRKQELKVMLDSYQLVKYGQKIKVIESGNPGYFMINVSDIHYAKADRNRCIIYTNNTEYIYTKNLLNFTKQVINYTNFKRVHKSYVINENYVENESNEYIIVSGNKIPKSRK